MKTGPKPSDVLDRNVNLYLLQVYYGEAYVKAVKKLVVEQKKRK